MEAYAKLVQETKNDRYTRMILLPSYFCFAPLYLFLFHVAFLLIQFLIIFTPNFFFSFFSLQITLSSQSNRYLSRNNQ